jgi:trehalose 6-phosphate synthase
MIVVSHRGPYRFHRTADGGFRAARGAGGVVSALGPLLLGGHNHARWIAAAIGDDDRAAVRAGAAHADDIDLCLLDLDPEDHRLHYDVVSNAVLWFLHHGMFDLVRRPRFDDRFRESWDAYVAVNRQFALAAADGAAAGTAILVQDYQLALVPGIIRAERPDLRVGYFQHTPFAGADGIRVLPTDVAHQIMASLGGGASGFHARRWADAYRSAGREILGSEPPAFVAPLGPDREALAATAASPEARAAAADLAETVGDRKVIFRTDRVEPSKNIVRGFLAYDLLLERRADLRGGVVFVAYLYTSRDTLPEYLAYANEVEQAVARVNDRWSTRDWQPIVLDVRDDFARSVAGLARYDVLLVNPIRDGMNLVAKEGPLVNERDGVVCLSPEAGAFEDLAPAVVETHPFDLDGAARALATALDEDAGARRERAARLRELAAARTPEHWLDDQLAALDAAGPTIGS